MSQLDPPRLDSIEGASELSDLVLAARRHTPGDDVLARIAGNLGLPPPPGGGGGAPAPSAPVASAAPGAAGTAASVKALAVAALVTGAGIAGWLSFGPAEGAAPPPSTPVALPAERPAEVPPSPPVSVAAPALPPPNEPAPKLEALPAAKPLASTAPARRPEPPSEVELVGKARSALRGDPALALVITEEHRKAYPRGSLAEEREVLAIEALAALGRRGAARARAAAFEAASPRSAYAARIARAIKKEEPPSH